MLGAVYEFASGNLGESRAPYARYLEWRESDCDLQAGVQLAGPMQSTDGTTTDHYSACKALVGVFIGPYHQLVDAHAEIRAYANAEGHVLSGPCWEVYDGPPAEDGTAKTVIYYPVLQ